MNCWARGFAVRNVRHSGGKAPRRLQSAADGESWGLGMKPKPRGLRGTELLDPVGMACPDTPPTPRHVLPRPARNSP